MYASHTFIACSSESVSHRKTASDFQKPLQHTTQCVSDWHRRWYVTNIINRKFWSQENHIPKDWIICLLTSLMVHQLHVFMYIHNPIAFEHHGRSHKAYTFAWQWTCVKKYGVVTKHVYLVYICLMQMSAWSQSHFLLTSVLCTVQYRQFYLQ